MACPTFWTEDPKILLQEAADFFPFHAEAKRCTTTALNSFTRFGLYLGIVLGLICGSMKYLLLSATIAIVAAATYHGMKSHGVLREGFQSKGKGPSSTLPKFPEDGLIEGSDAAEEYVPDIIGSTKRTTPTAANPFMNVLLTEIGDDPLKPPAENGEFLKRQFSNVFKDRIYNDPGDVFQKTQDQRVWAVQPNTSIPNDQESFQNWLFRVPGRTCKEGNSTVCVPATNGGTVAWLGQ